MFVIPALGAAGKRTPPLLTIGLIAINCLVYFLFQFNDGERYGRAMEYYLTSGLGRIELAAYIDYLRARGESAKPLQDEKNMGDEQRARLLARMMRDAAFQQKLERGQIITAEQEPYPQWQKLRAGYDTKLASVVFWHYGFRPAARRPVTFVTHMFLHGGVSHLLGNMIVLWLVGCIVELGCGRAWYPVMYLFGGLAAVCLFWLVYPESTLPLVGASGAIAAVMGAFAVLYGSKKIRVFYTLGFYFGYRQVYGFWLLPFWVGNEFYQLLYGCGSNVAYMAHVGGLVGGGLLGLACRRISGTGRADELVRQEAPDELSPLFAEAMEKQGRLDFDGARSALEQVLAREPENMRALQQLFTVELHRPEAPRFHAAAGRLLEKACAAREHALACQVYRQYRAAARPPRLAPALYLRIGLAQIEAGEPGEAEKIFTALLRGKPDSPGLAAALLKLADGLRKRGAPEKSRAWLQALCQSYPESPQARAAASALASRPDGLTG